jgi:hypothetical protein
MTFFAGATVVTNYQIGLHRFHFLAPVVLLFVAEVGGVVLFHAAIRDVLLTMVFGNAAILAATFFVPARAHAVRPHAQAETIAAVR